MNARRAVRIFIILILPILAAGLAAREGSAPATAGEDALLDAIFRIDIKTVQAALMFNPADNSVDGTCTLFFRMRPGQTRPVFHFKPLVTGELTAYTFQLDGETWDVSGSNSGAGSAILKVLDIPGTAQKSIEVERDAEYFAEFTGIDVRPDFLNWLYNGKSPAFSEPSAADSDASALVAKDADPTPPDPILRKYGLEAGSSPLTHRRHP